MMEKTIIIILAVVFALTAVMSLGVTFWCITMGYWLMSLFGVGFTTLTCALVYVSTQLYFEARELKG